MGKCNEHTVRTKVLYKKSNNTFFTQTRSGSSSQAFQNSGTFQVNRKISFNNSYYKDNDVTKKDLSMETNLCVLRRYCRKHKKNKMLEDSVNTRYSTTINSDVGSFRGFSHDSSASGDAIQPEEPPATGFDLTSLLIDNFKNILQEFIYKHMFTPEDDKDYEQFPANRGPIKSSSTTTYILDRNDHEMKSAQLSVGIMTSSNLTSVLPDKISHHTTPTTCKQVRIISTLSIPRKLHKTKPTKIRKCTQKSICYDQCIAPVLVAQKSKIISSVGVGAESQDNSTTTNQRKRVAFKAKLIGDSITDLDLERIYKNENKIQIKRKRKLKPRTSLVESIFNYEIDKTANVQPKAVTIDNSTMTDKRKRKRVIKHSTKVRGTELTDPQICSQNAPNDIESSIPKGDVITKQMDEIPKPLLTNYDVKEKNVELPVCINNNTTVNVDKIEPTTSCTRKEKKKARRKRSLKNTSKFSPRPKYSRIQYKRVAFGSKNSKRLMKCNELLTHFQNIYKFFSEHESNRDVKLDVCINVFPTLENVKTAKGSKQYKEERPNIFGFSTSHEENINLNQTKMVISKNKENILPNTTFAIENANEKISNDKENDNEIPYKEITKELSELKEIIQGLTLTTQKLGKEHNKISSEEETKVLFRPKGNRTVQSNENLAKSPQQTLRTSRLPLKSSNPSKGIQISSENLLAGLNYKKENTKEAMEFYTRLTKKSTSYRIIESESLLKVTDMTSKNRDIEKNRDLNEVAMPQSRSLFDIHPEFKKKRRIMAYYCDRCIRNAPMSIMRSDYKCQSSSRAANMCPSTDATSMSICNCHQYNMCKDSFPDNHAVLYTGDACPPHGVDDCRPSQFKLKFRRRSLGALGGFFYCFLMWIPTVIVIYLCVQTFRSRSTSSPVVDDGPATPTSNLTTNNAEFRNMYIRLSDLGF